MSTRVNTSALDGIAAKIRGIGGLYRLTLSVSALSLTKIESLRESGRDLFKPTPGMAAEMVRQALDALARGTDLAVVMRGLAEGLRAVAVVRLRNNGGDAGWTPDSPETRAAKAKRGQSTKTGIASGDLLRDLEGARADFVKR